MNHADPSITYYFVFVLFNGWTLEFKLLNLDRSRDHSGEYLLFVNTAILVNNKDYFLSILFKTKNEVIFGDTITN